jgi:hypothetical protein
MNAARISVKHADEIYKEAWSTDITLHTPQGTEFTVTVEIGDDLNSLIISAPDGAKVRRQSSSVIVIRPLDTAAPVPTTYKQLIEEEMVFLDETLQQLRTMRDQP